MTPADPLGRLVKAIQDEHAQSIPSSHFDLYDNCPHDVCEAARAAARAARPSEGADGTASGGGSHLGSRAGLTNPDPASSGGGTAGTPTDADVEAARTAIQHESDQYGLGLSPKLVTRFARAALRARREGA